MATVDLTDVRPYRDSFAEDRLGPPAELWAAPPLAPIGDEDAFHPPEPSDLSEIVWIPPTAHCRHCNRCGIRRSCAHLLLPGLARGESTRGNLSNRIFSNSSEIVIRDSGAAGSYCG